LMESMGKGFLDYAEAVREALADSGRGKGVASTGRGGGWRKSQGKRRIEQLCGGDPATGTRVNEAASLLFKREDERHQTSNTISRKEVK